MIGEQIRAARLAANLPQLQFAEMAGLARSRLQMLEEGGNVTLNTLEKAIASLPNLRKITLGGVEFIAIDRLTSAVAAPSATEPAAVSPPIVMRPNGRGSGRTGS